MSTAQIEEGVAPSRESDLRSLASRGADELRGASAQDALAWAFGHFGSGLVVACSMADAVLPHLATSVYADTIGASADNLHVLFLDTGYHFPETLATRDEVSRRLPVTVVNVLPALTVEEQDQRFGRDLFGTDASACCRMRKVEPLAGVLKNYSAWASGVRRSDNATRRDAPLVSWDDRHAMIKLNPLVDWSDQDIAAYIAEHDVPINPLIEQGYPSIGCGPCTLRPLPGGDPRSGRWADSTKTECGLHS